jgi:hypothetical protein
VDGGLETSVLSLGAWGENKAQMGGDPNDGKMINMDEKYMLIETPSLLSQIAEIWLRIL